MIQIYQLCLFRVCEMIRAADDRFRLRKSFQRLLDVPRRPWLLGMSYKYSVGFNLYDLTSIIDGCPMPVKFLE